MSAKVTTNWNSHVNCTHYYLAPSGVMTYKPASIPKFLNVIKRGYLTETCDVNLRDVCVTTNLDLVANIITGYDYAHNDIWRCARIDFDWTWQEAQFRNKTNPIPNKFRLYQVKAYVDITNEYKNHNVEIKLALNQRFDLYRKVNNTTEIGLTFDVDDSENFTYFGHKTSKVQQSKIKQYLFTERMSRVYGPQLSTNKENILNSIGYPNYCAVTPYGIFNALSGNHKEKEKCREWMSGPGNEVSFENECINLAVTDNGVNKVYYDEIKDKLLVKMFPKYRWILYDSNAPPPLKTMYMISTGNRCRLIEAAISDPRLIDKVKNVNTNDKKRKYFELLRKWKGFIIVTIDITKEFDQFQERLKKEVISKNNIESEFEWDNRKYFLNNKEMPFVKYNKKENKITYDIYTILDRKSIRNYNSKFNFFDILDGNEEPKILNNLFSFVIDIERRRTLRCVCKNWCNWDKFL